MTIREQKKIEDQKKLANLAALARKLRDADAQDNIDALERPLNYYIKKLHGLDNKEINTFNGWKEKGFKVKKGEKGYIFFSAPKTFKKDVENNKGENEQIQYKRFCKCFLFSQDQVEVAEQVIAIVSKSIN